MVEEKKPRAPRKPKTSKEIVSKDEVLDEEITPKEEIKEEITPKEETPKEKKKSELKADAEPVVAVLSLENPQDLEPVKTEIAEKIEDLKKDFPEVELGVFTPEEAFNEITELLANNQTPKAEQVETSKLKKGELKLQLKKLNPNLEDGKSKWAFQVSEKGLTHEVFRGSLLKAHRWAENYCIKHNIDIKSIQKIRK